MAWKQPHNQQRAALSPDGRWFAAVVSVEEKDDVRRRADEPWDRASVEVLDVDHETYTTLVKDAASWSPRWSPTGERLAFLSDHGGRIRVWGWAPGYQAAPLSDTEIAGLPFGDDAPQWFPDGRRLLVHLHRETRPADARVTPGGTESARRVDVLSHDPGLSGSSSRDNGPGIGAVSRDLAIVDIDTREAQRLVLHEGCEVAVLSPDGERVALQSPRHWPDIRQREEVCSVAIAFLPETGDALTGSVVARDLPYSTNGGRHLPAWSPDGRLLAVVDRDQISLYDVDTQDVRRLPVPAPLSMLLACWTPDGAHLIVADMERTLWSLDTDGAAVRLDAQEARPIGSSALPWISVADDEALLMTSDPADPLRYSLRHVPLDGRSSRAVFTDTSVITVAAFNPILGSVGDATLDGSRIVYGRHPPDRPAGYWLTSVNGDRRPLGDLNPDLRLPALETRRLTYESMTSGALGLHVLIPAERTPPYPTVIRIYTGDLPSRAPATWATWEVGIMHGSLLAEHGYALAAVDLPPGDRGLASSAEMVAEITEGAADALVEAGVADPACLVLIGWSGGAYAVALGVTATTRFAAAIAGAGVMNAASMFGSIKVGGPRTAFLHGLGILHVAGIGPPWEDTRALEYSPVFRADRITTPMLLVHGTEDEAVPVTQSDELYVALRYLNRDVTFLRYRGENHVPREFSPESREHLRQYALRWLDEKLDPAPPD